MGTSIKSLYLQAYNAASFVGWGAAAAMAWYGLLTEGSLEKAYEYARLPLQIVQTAAILEVAHASLGLVKSPVMVTAMQIASRLIIVWGIIALVPDKTSSGRVPVVHFSGVTFHSLNIVTLISAWAIADMIRYGYFGMKEAGLNPYFALWLRYSGFIVLYPYGVASEMSMIYLAYDTIKEKKYFTYEMPNPYNISFHYTLLIKLILLIYPPSLYSLYTYMLKARRKYLSTPAKKTA